MLTCIMSAGNVARASFERTCWSTCHSTAECSVVSQEICDNEMFGGARSSQKQNGAKLYQNGTKEQMRQKIEKGSSSISEAARNVQPGPSNATTAKTECVGDS